MERGALTNFELGRWRGATWQMSACHLSLVRISCAFAPNPWHAAAGAPIAPPAPPDYEVTVTRVP